MSHPDSLYDPRQLQELMEERHYLSLKVLNHMIEKGMSKEDIKHTACEFGLLSEIERKL